MSVEIQGAYSIDIVDPESGDVEAVIEDDDVEGIDIVRTHTAVSDWQATVPFSPRTLRPFMTSTFEVHIQFRGDLIFRGYLEKDDSDTLQNQTIIEGRGIGRDLLDFDIEYQAEDVDAHDAIADVWDQTPFDATVLDPDGDPTTIGDRKFEDDALTVLQELHELAGYRFSIDHEAESKTVESFEAGSVEQDVTFITRNRSPVIDLYDYANRVVVYGARDDDGERPKAEAVDTDEIDRLGGDPDDWDPSDPAVRSKIRRRPELESVDEVETEAKAMLEDAIREAEDTGTVEIQPTNVRPGYDYAIDWFDDGDPIPTTNETVEFSEAYQDASGEMTFERVRGVEAEIVASKRTSTSIANAI